MSVVGERGTVTVAIRGPERPGEVEVPCHGGTQTFIAYASEEIPRHAAVLVFDVRSGGVEVSRIN